MSATPLPITAALVVLACATSLSTTALAEPHTPLFGRHKVASPIVPAPRAVPVPVAAPTPPPPAPRPVDVAVAPVDAPTAAPAAPLTGIAQLRAAYAFALPVYEMMRARYLQVSKAEGMGAPGVNRLYARTVLADATSRDVTTPNNDTLYSSAWLDLAAGPVILDAPAMPNRYHSAALMDAFTNNVAIVGTRSGGTGGRYVIMGPGTELRSLPPGATEIHSPTNDAWLLVRVLVNGPDDLPAATGLIRGFTLKGRDAALLKPIAVTCVPTANPDAATFIAVVDEALRRNPVSPTTLARPELAALGVTTAGINPASVSPATMAEWAAALPKLRAEFKGGFGATGTVVDGWSYPGPGIGHYGDSDDIARARVALGGLGALPQTEAIYLAASSDSSGAALTGGKAYTVHLPPKLPVGAFWSLTMYEQEGGGRLFFVDTPSKRFAVGDRTPDLRAERDGGYDIFVQPKAPSGERIVNWLPSPKGPFVVVFRAYLPKSSFLNGSFRLPPVAATEVIP